MTLTASSATKAIIFDFGGVLIGWDPHPLYRPYFDDNAAIDRFLKEIKFPAWNAEQDRGRPFKVAVAEHTKKYPQYAELIRLYDEGWQKTITGALPGSVAILRELKSLGWPVYGLSNWSREKFDLVLPDFPFLDELDHIVLSGDVHSVKPEPEIFQIFLEQVGRPAEECLFIDDSIANIHTAQALGFAVIHFTTPEDLRRELEQRGLLSANGRRG